VEERRRDARRLWKREAGTGRLEERHGLMVMQAAPVTYKNTWRGFAYWREQVRHGTVLDGAVQEWQQKMTR
jgi:hypothetical protein